MGGGENADVIRFLTAHTITGREFLVVFVTNVSTGRFPQHYQSKPFSVPNDLSKGLKTGDDAKKLFEHEGRRLCYEVMTRALVRVCFVRAQGYGKNTRESKPSQFLEDLHYTTNPLIRIEHVPAPVTVAVGHSESPLEELVRKTRMQAKAAIDQGQFHAALQRLVELERLRLNH